MNKKNILRSCCKLFLEAFYISIFATIFLIPRIGLEYFFPKLFIEYLSFETFYSGFFTILKMFLIMLCITYTLGYFLVTWNFKEIIKTTLTGCVGAIFSLFVYDPNIKTILHSFVLTIILLFLTIIFTFWFESIEDQNV
ncbi:MAG: hypothetical protein WCW87_01520 [Candidatus Paceibacterota bacterium]